jgi:hypothetical protein
MCTALHIDVLERSIEAYHNPGPGAYDCDESVGVQISSTRKTGACPIFARVPILCCFWLRLLYTLLIHILFPAGPSAAFPRMKRITGGVGSSNPGPGAYKAVNLTGNRGRGIKMKGVNEGCSYKKAAPAYSFGIRNDKLKLRKNTPGPDYTPKISKSENKKAPAFRFGTAARVKNTAQLEKESAAKGPGPCYNPKAANNGGGKQPLSRRRTAPSFGFGTSNRAGRKLVVKAAVGPGPGQYNPDSSVGKQPTSFRPTAPSTKFGTAPGRSKFKTTKRSFAGPGPQYDAPSGFGKQVLSQQSKGPTFAFSSGR